jgi:hypothetical protein
MALARALQITGMPDGVKPWVEGHAIFTLIMLPEWDDGRNHVALLHESEAAFAASLADLDGLDLRPLDGRYAAGAAT